MYRELFESFASDPADPVQGFQSFFAGAAQVLEESGYIDPCPIGTIAREVANTSEPLRLAAEEAFASWITSAQRFLVSAGIDEGAADRLATAFVTNVEGAFVLSRTTRTTDPIRAVDSLISTAIAAALEHHRARAAATGT